MAKCEVCEKSIAHGNKISIARSHVREEHQELLSQILEELKL